MLHKKPGNVTKPRLRITATSGLYSTEIYMQKEIDDEIPVCNKCGEEKRSVMDLLKISWVCVACEIKIMKEKPHQGASQWQHPSSRRTSLDAKSISTKNDFDK